MPPAPGGQGRDWQRSGRSRQRPGRCTWLSSGLPSTKQVPSTWSSSPVLCGRVQAGEPEHSRFWLELALVGELQPQEPTRQPQPIPAAPAHQSVPLPEPHRAAQSHSEDKEFGNSPAASLPRPPAPGSPLAPAGGRQRGIFRVVLSLRIRALSIRSWRSRSNERCMREGAPEKCGGASVGVPPRPPLLGCRAQVPTLTQPDRLSQPARADSKPRSCPRGTAPSAAALVCGGLLQQEPRGLVLGSHAGGQLWSWGNAQPSHPPTPQVLSKPKPD